MMSFFSLQDINSLYPFISWKFKFNSGPSLLLRGQKLLSRIRLNSKDNDDDNVDEDTFLYCDPDTGQESPCGGIMQCIIGLEHGTELDYVPFLPIKVDNKVFRPLCYACLLEKRTSRACDHKELKTRAWRGVYCLHEIAYAVKQLNYVILKIEEVLVYPQQEFLFKDYMKLLAAQKIKHQKPPTHLKTPADLEQYCHDINSHLDLTLPGEKLTPDMLQHDPSSVDFYKLQMNSSLVSIHCSS